MAGRFFWTMATAIQLPMPGRAILVFPTLNASAMVTKNQPPDMLIIMFQIRDGMAKGASIRQKRAQPLRPNMRPASSSSGGTVRSDWKKLKAMFQAWPVKMEKMQASSAPKMRPGDSDRNHTMVIDRKERIGMDCRISSNGTSRVPARGFFAAQVA